MATALRRRRTARRRTVPTVVHQLTQVAPRTSADVWGAARAAVALAGPLIVLVAVDRSDLTVYATFGAFAALHGRYAAPRARRRMQLVETSMTGRRAVRKRAQGPANGPRGHQSPSITACQRHSTVYVW